MVTTQVLDHHYLGKDIILEDQGWDDYYDNYGEVSVSVGAGDTSSP